jgi:Ca-activated chloride channel family protein
MGRRIAALLLFVAAAAVADDKPMLTLKLVRSAMLLLKTNAPGFYAPAATVETSVALRVRGLIIRGEVTQRFSNPGPASAEALYAFPLPETTSVDRLRVTAGERVTACEIRPQPNLITASIANISAGDEVVVETQYRHAVQYKDGVFRLRFPAMDCMHLSVDLDFGVPLRRVDSPSHELEATTLSTSHYLLSTMDTPADRDFELTWQPDLGREPQSALFTEDNYALLMLMPAEGQPLANVELHFDDPAAEVSVVIPSAEEREESRGHMRRGSLSVRDPSPSARLRMTRVLDSRP